jgi:hypothetical protein
LRGKSLITRAIRCLLLTGLLLSMLSSFAQAPNQLNGSIEEPLVATDIQTSKTVLDRNSLGQAPDGPDDCELKFPYPRVAAKTDPYAENGAEICKNLQIRGQRMQCEIDALVGESPSKSSTTGAKIELASWARCNSKVASMLIAGYYIPASEIERRLQICSSNFYADPGKAPKLGWYQRFLKWYASNDLTPPPSDATLEVAIKQSTPIDSQQDMAGLMKCEWMFSRSRAPFINPLPGGSQADAPPTSLTAPAKKSSPKKPAANNAQ